MVKEVHEIWVNEDASFDCESHSVKGEKCLAKIDEFEKKKEYHETHNKGVKSKSQNKQHRGAD